MRKLLDKINKSELSKSVIFNTGLARGGETTPIIQTLPILNIATNEQYDLLPITLTISSYIIKQNTLPPGGYKTNLLQGVLKFGCNQSQFGYNQENVVLPPPVPVGYASNPYSPEVIFDIDSGTILTIPGCAGLTLEIRHTSIQSIPFVAGQHTGHNYHINAGLNYEISKATAVTKTDWPVFTFNKNMSALFSRPQFAKSITFQILSINPAPTGNMFIGFFDNTSIISTSILIPWPSQGIFPDIDWPCDALYCIITNLTDKDIPVIRAQHLLAF